MSTTNAITFQTMVGQALDVFLKKAFLTLSSSPYQKRHFSTHILHYIIQSIVHHKDTGWYLNGTLSCRGEKCIQGCGHGVSVTP
jgi:hypothetical protein